MRNYSICHKAKCNTQKMNTRPVLKCKTALFAVSYFWMTGSRQTFRPLKEQKIMLQFSHTENVHMESWLHAGSDGAAAC